MAGVTNAVAPAAASEDEKSDDDHDDRNSLWKKTLKIKQYGFALGMPLFTIVQ